MLVIRLTRVGKKNSPSYRVVVADKQRAVKRKFIEIIGNYNPTLTPKQLVIDKDRALFWIGRGAQPSDTVNNLMVRLDILPKEKMINKVYGKKLSKKAIKEGPKAETPKAEETAPEMDHEQNEPLTEEVTETTEPATEEEKIEDVPAEVEPTETTETENEPEIADAVEPEAEPTKEKSSDDSEKSE